MAIIVAIIRDYAGGEWEHNWSVKTAEDWEVNTDPEILTLMGASFPHNKDVPFVQNKP